MALAAALVLFAASCSRSTPPALTREAFLFFDNLTGDPSLDWIAQTAPRVLEHDFTGVPRFIPFLASTVRDAYLARAARLVHGYYELRAGKLHFEIQVEDAASHRTVRRTSQDGGFLDAVNRAAKSLDSGALDFPASGDAVTAWGQGNYERAVMLDPSFASAWLSWVQQLAATGAGSQARDVMDRALAQPDLRSPLDRARLELAGATLREEPEGKIKASRKLVDLIPYDPSLLSELTQAEMTARHFTDAAKDYQTLAKNDPADATIKNSLGYAEALAGDLDSARKAFQEYGHGPGQAGVNALDSLGEALFINGKFDEAETVFTDAYKKDPAFLQGATIWKAAHARWLAGDLTEADQILQQYWQDRAKVRDPLLSWRRASWLYETGRRLEAQDLLMQPSDANRQAEAAAKQQLQVWGSLASIHTDIAQLEQSYRRSDPVNDGLVRTLYAEALLHAGRNEEARDLVKRWPLPEREDSPLQSVMYPKFLELRQTLHP